MKTAVIYSGEARTFAQVFFNQYWHILRKLPDPTFFVSVADDEQAPFMSRLHEFFPMNKVHFERVIQPLIPEPTPDSKWLNIYLPSVEPQKILRQLWSLQRAWVFFSETCCRLEESKFDLVVRIRPDLAFGRFVLPCEIETIIPTDCFTPYWARWGGVNDRLAVMGLGAANNYFNTFSRIYALMASGCPLHPEQLINASLQLGAIEPKHTLAAEFITVRLDGSFVPMSVTEIDKLEYSRA